jgi:hypothetical protein
LTAGWQHDKLSGTTVTLDTVLRRAIRRAPCTIRALARTAGVSHSVLAAIATGQERATTRVALKVARALQAWAARCEGEAAAVRAAVKGHTQRRDV